MLLRYFVLIVCIKSGLTVTCTTNDYAGLEKALTKKDRMESGNLGRGHVMLDPFYRVPCCGVVRQWDIYVKVAGTVHVQIWRSSSSSAYQLVGQNNFTFSSASLKEQYLTIASTQRIHVQQNDIIGWYSPGDEVIPYKEEGSGSVIIQEAMPAVSIGGVFDWSTGSLHSKRYYAVKALLDPGNAPVMTTFPGSVTIKHTTPLGTSVYTPVISNPDQTTTYQFALSGAGNFAIDSQSGNITLSSSLTTGTYSLSVTVTDACGRSHTQSFNVISTNTAPTIRGLPYNANLHENTATETLLHSFSVEDDDGDSTTCTLENTSPSTGSFLIKTNYSNGGFDYKILSKSSPDLSYTSVNTYTLNISCSDGSAISYGTFIVYIMQNVAPSFTNLPHSLTLSVTSTSKGTSVYQVHTSDPDSNTLMISNTCSPSPCPFSAAVGGAVTTSGDLRLETNVSYSLHFYVNDSSSSTGPVVLTIILTDLNTAPTFQNIPHSLYISEHLSATKVIYQISVKDPDVSDVLSTIFTVQPSVGNLLFDVNATDLTIRRNTGASINFEKLTTYNYTIYVTVSDGIFSSSSSLMISILDDNDPPSFNQNTYYVSGSEGQKGTALQAVGFIVLDEDSGDTSTFSITDRTNFVINGSTGVISFAIDLELSETSIFNLTVQVADSGGLTDTCTVVVTLQNMNKKPYFTNLPNTISVPENTATGSLLISLALVDEDLAPTTVSYSVSPVLSSNLFSYNITESKLYLANGFNFDYETTTVYNITFEANDGMSISDPELLCLEIVNVNEPPSFQSSTYYVTFQENKSGYSLPNITYDVSDPDAGDIASYKLIDGDYITRIGMDSVTGQMHLTADLFVDNTVNSNLTVQATDKNGLSSTAIIQIAIYDVNKSPYFTNLPFTVSVDENIQPESVVYDVTARDDDTADVCTCSVNFLPPTATTVLLFDSSDNKIKLRANATLNFQLYSQVLASVTVQDPTGATSTANLTINIVNINESPVLSSSVYYGNVNNGQIGLPVQASISAVDPDVTDVLTFSIISQSVDGMFSINSSSGSLYTAMDDVYKKSNGNCTLVIQVHDQYGAKDQATVIINVHHMNTKPEITNFTENHYVSEALPIGSLLNIFPITDPDPNDVITERVAWKPASAVNKFHLNITNRQLYLYLKDVVDFETESSYNLTLILNDGSEDSQTYGLILVLIDVNEPPVVQHSTYHVSINEATSGTTLDLNITISDPDVGDTVTCNIFSGNNNQYFGISPTTCKLFLAKDYDIDLGLPSSHTLTINIVDSKGLSATTTVNVQILDINDNIPQFDEPQYVAFIAPDSLTGYQILIINVSDGDSSQNAKLACQMDTSHFTALFTVTTGCVIYQTGNLDGLAGGTEINFTVVVRDAGSPSLSSSAIVRIIVQGTAQPQADTVYQVNTDSNDIDLSDWKVQVGCGAIGLSFLLAVINSIALLRRGCSKKTEKGKDHSNSNGKERTEKKVERKEETHSKQSPGKRRHVPQNSHPKARRTYSPPITTPKMETISVSDTLDENLDRILTPTDIPVKDLSPDSLSYENNRHYTPFFKQNRRVSVMGPQSNRRVSVMGPQSNRRVSVMGPQSNYDFC